MALSGAGRGLGVATLGLETDAVGAAFGAAISCDARSTSLGVAGRGSSGPLDLALRGGGALGGPAVTGAGHTGGVLLVTGGGGGLKVSAS
jgi:hypothetical protein